MEISIESPQTSQILPFTGTDYIGHKTVEFDDEAEPPYTLLARNLVDEWLNQALDNYELSSGSSVCQHNALSLHCETSNGSSVKNQVCSISGDAVEYSAPSLKQLSYKASETSDNHVNLQNLTVGSSFAEGKQTRGKCKNGIEVKGRSLSCSLLLTNVSHKLQHLGSVGADLAECKDVDMHVCELDHSSHSKGSIRHTKSETFLQHIMKEVDYLKSDHAGDHSECNLASGVSRDGELTVVHNLITVHIKKAEHCGEKSSCKDLQNADTNDENLSQIPVSEHDMTENFIAAVNANSDSLLANKQPVVNDDIRSQDASENIPCKVIRSSSDCTSTNNGSEIFLSSPEVQVSFLALSYVISMFFLVAFCSLLISMLYVRIWMEWKGEM